jgi:hypothetical protein
MDYLAEYLLLKEYESRQKQDQTAEYNLDEIKLKISGDLL